MKGYAFLFWAYTIVWTGIAGYIVFMIARLRRVDRILSRLERRIEGETGPDGSRT